MCCINSLDILKGLLTPLIAAIAAYIAYQQYFLNKRKLNLDLYEKRYKIYFEIKIFIERCIAYGKITQEERRDFLVKTNEKYFLFDSDIIEYIDELDKKAVDLEYAKPNYRGWPAGTEKFKKGKQEERELFDWFRNERDKLEAKFIKYLDFRKLN